MEQNFFKQALAYKLKCKVDKLDVLLKFDTELGKEVADMEYALTDSPDSLYKIVYRFMDDVKCDVTYEAQDILKDQLDDTTKAEVLADNNIHILDEKSMLDMLGYMLAIMPDAEKFIFDTELDKTLDFSLSVRDNAINLIKHLTK
jgi:hypothetical protein